MPVTTAAATTRLGQQRSLDGTCSAESDNTLGTRVSSSGSASASYQCLALGSQGHRLGELPVNLVDWADVVRRFGTIYDTFVRLSPTDGRFTRADEREHAFVGGWRP